MTITAKVIADSISPNNVRLTTLQLRYPRFIHAEFMTHRMFSRNASSSRAIPVERLIQDIIDDTAMPIHWGMNQKGMQADEENYSLVLCGANKTETDRYGPYREREEAWKYARDRAIEMAQNFANADYHKQIVNRLLEPFSHINVLVTATEWANFFALRDHPDAQPEMQKLAREIRAAMALSKPVLRNLGEWHLPYVDEDDWIDVNGGGVVTPDQIETLRKISVARCARVSYMTHEGKRPTIEEDLALYERLVGAHPMHASPAEHQATPDEILPECEGPYDEWRVTRWKWPWLHGNFRGWIQFRKTLPGENITDEG